MRRLIWRLTPLAIVAAFVLTPLPAAGQVREATPAASAYGPCPMPELAQQLAKDAVAIEPTGHGARFLMRPVAAMQDFGDLAINASYTPPANHSGNWRGWGQGWIAWIASVPCSGPDGYAFAFNTRCYNGATVVTCNFEGQGGLEYDHASADWDGVWGYRYYHELSQTSCADSGTYHYFSDSSPGRLRTLMRFHFRFVPIDYLTQWRRMTSHLLRISDHLVYPGTEWTTSGASSTPPGTQSSRTEC
jgi:hypothetical protein